MIEKAPVTKGRSTGNWMPVNSSPVTGNAFTVPNLTENSEWEFRVVAVNDAGLGKPSKSTGPHTVRDPVCTLFDSYMPEIIQVSDFVQLGDHIFSIALSSCSLN